jgi:hypothetical protein
MSQSSNSRERHEALAAWRPSRLDRRGPDGALLLRVGPFVAVMLGGWTLLFSLLGLPLPVAIIPAALLTAGITWAGLNAASAVGRVVGSFLLPSGESTPYEHQFSREDAMAARGDVDGAIESLEGYIASTPLDAQTGINVRIRAAELYMSRATAPKAGNTKAGDLQRAVELLKEIQRFEGASASQDIYVSNRLIDLLLGPLRQPSRALVELSRLVARYPTSAAATHARTAIAKLKEELRQETAENEKYTGF